jgi:hypothetical protein
MSSFIELNSERLGAGTSVLEIIGLVGELSDDVEEADVEEEVDTEETSEGC